MSCGQNDITKSPDHVNFVTLKIEKSHFSTVTILCPLLSGNLAPDGLGRWTCEFENSDGRD